MAKKFPKQIFVLRDEQNGDCLIPGESLNSHAEIGKRVRVAEYELKRVVEITADARVVTEIGE